MTVLRILRRTVRRLCQTRRADEALRLLEQIRQRCLSESGPPELQIAYWRLLGLSLSECGHLRRSAEAFRHMLRLMQKYGVGLSAEDWGLLAAAYRALWRKTGRHCYYRNYLKFTCEQTDTMQVAMASRALLSLKSPYKEEAVMS